MIIKKVYQNKSNKQLLVSIPAKEGIENGDHVEITKIEKSKGE